MGEAADSQDAQKKLHFGPMLPVTQFLKVNYTELGKKIPTYKTQVSSDHLATFWIHHLLKLQFFIWKMRSKQANTLESFSPGLALNMYVSPYYLEELERLWGCDEYRI